LAILCCPKAVTASFAVGCVEQPGSFAGPQGIVSLPVPNVTVDPVAKTRAFLKRRIIMFRDAEDQSHVSLDLMSVSIRFTGAVTTKSRIGA
jgi:hypothetical protein